MAIGSGQVSLGDIATEYGGDEPHALSEYYDKGNAPGSGEVQIHADFQGTSNTTTTYFVVIAGGGGGGTLAAGAGGAGGYRSAWNSETSGGGASAQSALALTPGTQYTVTVGGGGGAGQNGGSGSASSIAGSGITTVSTTGGGGGSGGHHPNNGGGEVVLGVRALQAVQVEEVVVHNMATHMEMVAVPQALQVKVMLVAMEHPMEIQAAVAVVALAQLEVLM